MFSINNYAYAILYNGQGNMIFAHDTTRRITHHHKTYHNTRAHRRGYTVDLKLLTEVQQFQQEISKHLMMTISVETCSATVM
jgi:hypothetical protein